MSNDMIFDWARIYILYYIFLKCKALPQKKPELGQYAIFDVSSVGNLDPSQGLWVFLSRFYPVYDHLLIFLHGLPLRNRPIAMA